MLTMSADEARKNPPVKLALSSILKDEFEVEQLYSGDFAALDTPLSLGVERKTFANLVMSLASNELDEQLSRMVDIYDIPVLLIEGLPAPQGNGRVRVYGAQRDYPYAWIINSISAWWMRGVLPIFVDKQKSTPLTVAALYDLAKKTEHRECFAPKRILPTLRPMTMAERVMMQFPGVGEKRASLFRGQALADLATQDEEAWQAQLGKVTGKRVWEAWRTS